MVIHGPRRIAAVVLAANLLLPGLTLATQQQEVSSGKIPVTTASEEARELYLMGRDLQDKIRATDAREYYEQAVAADPNFAIAYLALANTAPSAKEFFDNLNKAVAAVDHASDGERRLILATDAGVKGEPPAQREHLGQLVSSFPNDERAHTALGNYYFGRQEWDVAVGHYTHATEINAEFSPPYNNLGYAHRFLGSYDEAEEAFKKYIELIPDEPNPYDSYAELLMKMGRFQESIETYARALELNRQFVPSYVGIANNLIFLDEGEKARMKLRELRGIARTTGERRTALVWTAASYVHEGNTDKALESVEAMYGIAEENGDDAAMSGDLILMGNILLYADEPDKAAENFERATEMMQGADVPAEVKEANRRNQLYREARVALRRHDLETAKAKTEAYAEQVEKRKIPFEQRRVHELWGAIALDEDNPAGARDHLAQANQQNPRILFMQAMAYHDLGDAEMEKEMLRKTAYFNGLNFNYAYVRSGAKKIVDGES